MPAANRTGKHKIAYQGRPPAAAAPAAASRATSVAVSNPRPNSNPTRYTCHGAWTALVVVVRRSRRAVRRSVRVFVLAPGAGLLGPGLRRSIEEERVVWRNERVWRHDRVRVVHASVIAREGDPARALAQAVLELGSNLAPPPLEPLRRVLDHRLDLGDLFRLLGREGESEVEGELHPVRRNVRELPSHSPLVGDEPIDRRAREADQRHVALVQMHTRGVELIPQVRTPGAGAELVIGPVHDVVGEQLRAPVKELCERLLPVLGVELVLLLHRNPGKLTPLF